MFTQAAVTAATIETAKVVSQAFVNIEKAYGPQPKLRHLLHMAQAELERVMKMASGSILPDGGTNKPGS